MLGREQEEAEKRDERERKQRQKVARAKKRQKIVLEAAFDDEVDDIKKCIKEAIGELEDPRNEAWKQRETKILIEARDANDNSPVGEAAAGGANEAIEFLIEGGAAACLTLYKKGYDVVVASIDLSFTGEPFHEIKELMPYCTRIVKCKSVCSVCQKDARYTYKKTNVKHVEVFESDGSVEQIQVGGAELYEPRCQEHHSYMCD